jgi:GT2 family glycosyltransferase
VSLPRIAIILVNWNNYDDSVQCLESIKKCTYQNREITVVDNGSDGNDAQLLAEKFGDEIRIIENERNLGFAKGCNVGIRDALARDADYVVLLNNDTIVAPDFLDGLVGVLQGDGEVGIAGGKILCHEYPDLIWSAGGTINYRTGSTPMRGSGEVDDGKYGKTTEVDWVCSCFMIVSRDVLEDVGLFDERFFFGWEDADLCVRAAQKGHRVVYIPGSVVWHKGFGEEKKERLKGKPLYYATRGHFIFIGKHFNRKQILSSGLHFITRFPRAMWDYSRITGQWIGPIYMFRAVFDYMKMLVKKRR